MQIINLFKWAVCMISGSSLGMSLLKEITTDY